MGLVEYHKKRDFSTTPEPRGEVGDSDEGALSFVVQKHDATRLHYDFRLEHDGVLLSWAVPKGPSLDPSVRRLAMRTEDHPLDYADFEGVIPKGEYGGGTVLLWDRGGFLPEGDVRQGLRKGKLRFRLDGEKLKGTFQLVRTSRKDEEREAWMLMKLADEHAIASGEEDVTSGVEESVATSRTLAEVARARDRVWSSKVGEVRTSKAAKARARSFKQKAKRVQGAKEAEEPQVVAPALATLVGEAPRGGGWIFEPKYDGYRLIARKEGDDVVLLTRNAKDWTARFPGVARAVRALPARSLILDGEACVMLQDGRTDFQALQNAERLDPEEVSYVAFDLLFVEGVDLRGAALLARKRVLAEVLADAPPALVYGDHVEGDGAAFHEAACRLGLEGILAKRAENPYKSGRGRDWLKVKCHARQELVVGGFTAPKGARKRFGALLLGAYEGDRLRYVGKVGTGFTGEILDDLMRRLLPLERKTSPFSEPLTAAERRGVRFVEPSLVVEVEFHGFTDDGRLRHPTYRGVREDKPARAVVREEPAPPPPASSSKTRAASGRRAAAPTRRGRGAPPPGDENVVAGVALTSPGRVLDEETGLTKLRLARYMESVAPHLLPHVVDRPLSVVRCPEGTKSACFFQKHPKDVGGAQASSIKLPARDSGKRQLAVENTAHLVALVQQGVMEVHPWGSRKDRLEQPDVIVMDLDPDEGLPFDVVVESALALREMLGALGLTTFVKTTGGKGLHVVIPFRRGPSWEDVKGFAKGVATTAAAAVPQRFTSTVALSARKGRIYVDWLRNARGATAIAPYSTRARPGARVATPLSWDELASGVNPKAFGVDEVERRLARGVDPWRGFFEVEQVLAADAFRRLGVKRKP